MSELPPEPTEAEIDQWFAWLDAQFAHADYLQLNRKWKEVRLRDTARMIAREINAARFDGTPRGMAGEES